MTLPLILNEAVIDALPHRPDDRTVGIDHDDRRIRLPDAPVKDCFRHRSRGQRRVTGENQSNSTPSAASDSSSGRRQSSLSCGPSPREGAILPGRYVSRSDDILILPGHCILHCALNRAGQRKDSRGERFIPASRIDCDSGLRNANARAEAGGALRRIRARGKPQTFLCRS
jgi:hypothetical protein